MGRRPTEIDPELRAATALGKLPLNAHTLWLWRLLTGLVRAWRIPDDVLVEDRRIPGRRNGAAWPDLVRPEDVPVRMYRPRKAAAPSPALVWLHGGGYVMGQPGMSDRWCIQCAQALAITVVSVDYRLAPEHPFPAALMDSYAALQWAAAQPGIDGTRLAIGGASAGGGLAAALAQLAHDRGEVTPVFQLLVYPMLDDRTSLRTDLAPDIDLAWSRESNCFGWVAYLGDRADGSAPPAYAAPARRMDLSGLPPAWIGVGSHDLFRDECLAYAERLRACGVDCELMVASGAPHGFEVAAPGARVARDFRQAQVDALRTGFRKAR